MGAVAPKEKKRKEKKRKEKKGIAHLFLTLALAGGAWLVAFLSSFTVSIGLPIPTK